ncbi:exonuclease SbcC [Thermanaeromonas toyohensis ToBE]|uniref:Nuclease SbcCD subunit C n=1 Tax=Thermanaeromonas toyohensis ToBE TaxID=698762 RepID=A0A1W1W1H5_9FIRM|nr:SbcC/MukB-like Walker B domain-containing protein [Thermanaeromonas toyohensis]SMB99465.1 exonuclease SbcC [Thermanaeromonas toyohensis ToBE]
MRPLELVFSGLHSYREEQHIDFTELSRYGLFGIFGPTGAGKSTILDAITLALFGSVDRAERGRRGILNQEEHELWVSFSFELGGQVFRVERLYTRDKSDPFSVRARNARLIRGTSWRDGLEVLASTPNEVDLQVVKILGLRKEDFTRAVVLPQGKFDEFLKLTGGERAKMLEYIFNLERYGDELAEKAKKVLLDCEQRLSNIAAEEAGMGDASEEALIKARQAVSEQLRKVQELEGAVQACRKQWEEMEELRRLHERLEQAKVKYETLQKERAFWEEQRKVLELAAKAEPLRQDLIREEEITCEIQELERIRLQAQAKENQAERAWHQAKVELEEAEKRRKQELPEWQERLAALKAAVEKAKERDALSCVMEKQVRELNSLRQKMEELSVELEGSARALEILSEQQKNILTEMRSIEVDVKEKEDVERAVQLLIQLEDRERELSTWRKKYEEEKARVEREFKKLKELVEERLPEARVEKAADFAPLVEAKLKEIQSKVESLQLSKERILAEEQAAILASSLRPGDPCPVCGSREHPRPASTEEVKNKLKGLEKEREIAEQELQVVRAWRDLIFKGVAQLDALYQTLYENIQPELKRLEIEVEELAGRFSQIASGKERESVRKRWEEIKGKEKRLNELARQREKLEEEVHKADVRVRELKDEIQNLKIAEGSLKGELASYEARQYKLKEEIRQVAGEQDPHYLLAVVERSIQELEEKVNMCRERRDTALRELNEVQKELAALESKLEGLKEEEQNLKERLEKHLAMAGFATRGEARAALLEEGHRQALARDLEDFERRLFASQEEIKGLEETLAGREFKIEAWQDLKAQLEKGEGELLEANKQLAVYQKELERIEQNHQRWLKLKEEEERIARRRDLADTLRRILSGRKFVEFLAEEQLRDMTLEASRRLGALTGQRYALELDERCEFVLRDDFHGGQRRPVSSLSGGETFLTSLSLALALSSQLQLKGRYPLGFFFLDEGFGTLDGEKLEVVLQALERLRLGQCLVGVISHVRELKERIPVYLEVIPPGPDGSGSRIRLVKNL